MEFELTAEQRDVKNAVKEFAEKEFEKEIALQYDLERKFPFQLLKKAGELGFVGVHYGEEYGGQGLGALENALIVEEFCRADSGLGSCIVLTDFAR
jgi:alkylation response protein AidB-like acyl-CoA dehydrogenase